MTLVNTLGEEAQVNVIPVAQGKKGPDVGTSRAADANGVWDLKIEMKSSVTANNIGTAFAAKNEEYIYKNVKYALAVDGKVATDYIYYVDTDKTKAGSNVIFKLDDGVNATTTLCFKENGEDKKVVDLKDNSNPTNDNVAIPVGTDKTTTLYLTQAKDLVSVDRVYDSYLEIKDQDLADKYGITVDGMTITTASDKAAALKNFPLIVHVLDIHGNEVEANVTVNFASSTQVGQELGDQTYTLMPSADANKRFILVDLKDVFTSLTADEAVAVSTNAGEGTVTWFTVKNSIDNKLFDTTGSAVDGLMKIKTGNSAGDEVLFYETKEDALAHGLKYDEDVAIKFTGNTADIEASTIRKIAYAVIPFESIKKDALPDASTPLTVVLKDKDGNEIRKAAGTYTVTLPAFDEVLVANNNKVWKENTFYTRVSAIGDEEGSITIEKPFKSKLATDQIGYLDLNEADNRLSYELKYTDFAKKDQYINIKAGKKTADLKGDIVSDDKHKLVNDIDVVATLDVLGTGYKNFKVTKEFKVYLQSVFEGASLSYYKNNVNVLEDGGVMTLGDYQYVYDGYTKDNKKYGLFMSFDGEEQEYNFNSTLIKFTQDYAVNGIKYVDVKKPSKIDIPGGDKGAYAYIYANDGASGTLTTANKVSITNTTDYGATTGPGLTRDALKVNLADQNSGELIFTFVDKMGVKVDVTLNYQKNDPETAE